jgi:RNA polymerase sigma factor for flagellar operon FliA
MTTTFDTVLGRASVPTASAGQGSTLPLVPDRADDSVAPLAMAPAARRLAWLERRRNQDVDWVRVSESATTTSDQGRKRRPVDGLWQRYKLDWAPEDLDRLILHYSPMVKYVAGRLSGGLPDHVEQADLVSYGIFGLIDAIDKYDIARDNKFETYAVTRIKGAIIDGLRSIDWVPRSVRAKGRAVERANATLEARLLRTPTDAEVAKEMAITEAELQKVYTQISFVGLVALDKVLSSGSWERGESITPGDALPDRGEGPEAAFEVEEMKQILAGAINRLGDKEKIVLTLYYYEGFTLKQIGEVLDVTESRVCQIHTKAILRLRARMSGLAAATTPAASSSPRSAKRCPHVGSAPVEHLASRNRGRIDLTGDPQEAVERAVVVGPLVGHLGSTR